MAFVITERASANSGTSGVASQTTAAFTPTANSRLFVFATAERVAHTTARTWTCVDSLALSWTKLDESTILAWETQSGYHLNSVAYYTDIGGSPASMTVTMDASTSTEYYGVVAFDVTGHNTGSPFPQVSVDNGATVNPASSSASGTLTLGSTPTSGNLVVAMWGVGGDGTGGCTAPTGYSTLTNQTVPNTHVSVFYHLTTTTAAVTCSDLGTTVGNWGGIIFEMALASAGTSIVPIIMAQYRQRKN